MSAAHIAQWLTLLDGACADVPTPYLDLIIDQAVGNQSLIAAVRAVHPPLSWRSLFTGMPEEQAEDLAPLLVRVNLHQPTQRQWLLGLLNELLGKPQVLALTSNWSFEALADYLGRCLEACNGGQTGLLRYYDPRLFALLFDRVLSVNQQQQLLRPAVVWSWLDHDQIPQRLLGLGLEEDSATEFVSIELSDQQIDTLLCAHDATCVLAKLTLDERAGRSAEMCFQLAYSALCEASAANLISEEQREARVRQHLAHT